jgi:hypothetical protein
MTEEPVTFEMLQKVLRHAVGADDEVDAYTHTFTPRTRCPACYDSFSGPWCDNCDRWPCTCVSDDSESDGGSNPTESTPDRAQDD